MGTARSWLWLALAALHCGPRATGPAGAAKGPEPAAPVASAPPARPARPVAAATAAPHGEFQFVEVLEQGPAVPPIVPGYVNFYIGAVAPGDLPASEPGQAVRVHETSSRLRPGEVPRFYPGVLDEWLKFGYTVADHRVGRRARSASLVHPSGPRVLVRVYSDEQLHIDAYAIRKPATPPTMPGPCVEIPTVGFEIPWFRWEGARRERYVTEFDIDLDNDGVFDAVVPLATRCLDDVRYALFVTRGKCGHHVGTVGPFSPSMHVTTKPAPSGLKDLGGFTYKYVAAADGTVRTVQTHTRYAFDGTAYREVDIKVLDEPCHECEMRECLGPEPLPPEPPMPP